MREPACPIDPPPIRVTVIASGARITDHYVLAVDADRHRQGIRVPVRCNRQVTEWPHVHDRSASTCAQNNQPSGTRIMTVAERLQRTVKFPFGLGVVRAQLPQPFRRPRPRAIPLCGGTTGQRGHCPEVVSNGPQRLSTKAQREALVIVAVARVRVGLPDDSGEEGRTAADRLEDGLGCPTTPRGTSRPCCSRASSARRSRPAARSC